MAFTRYASVEANVLSVKGSSERRVASLDKLSDFEDFRTEDGYLYARIRAISSRVNKNHDGWPSVELAGGPEVFDKHTASEGFTVESSKNEYGFSTFVGKPFFVDHHNTDPAKLRGVIVDSKFHVEDHKTAALDPYYASKDVDPEHLPPSWVELLIEVDARSFPRLARAIIEGSRNPTKGIDGFSMGCDVDRSVCSICKNSATSPEEFCTHIKLKGMPHRAADGTERKSYENCYGVKFFEISAVFDPADETALLREVRSSHTAGLEPGEHSCPGCGYSGTDWIPGEAFADGRPGDGTLHCSNCGQVQGSSVMGGDGAYAPALINHRDTDGAINTPAGFGPNIGPVHQGSTHLAENPLPQYEQPHAPTPIDTLREEKICPVCGSEMDEETCEICNYTEPPEGFRNPDLTKAKDTDLRMEDAEQQGQDGVDVGDSQGGDIEPKVENSPRNPGPVSHVRGDMPWDISVNPRFAGRINTSETPAIPGNGPVTDEPTDKVLSDQTKPVTSSVRTASDFIAAAGRNKETTMSDNRRVAAEPIPGAENQSGSTSDHDQTRVDVTGIGGAQEASNEAASKADSQVNVLDKGGTGEEDVKSDKTVEVEQGDEHSKNVESIPTKTFPNDNQHDPVTNEVFEGAGKQSSWGIQALDSGPYPSEEMANGAYEQTAVQGTQPADPVGKAEDRVNLLDPTTSPSNNSGPTKTWSGTDGNGVTVQQDPVTNESIALGESGMHNSHVFTAFKLAELEVELGLLDAEKKFERAAELETTDSSIVEASLRYAQRVKMAAKKRTAATRLPVLGRNSNAPKAAAESEVEEESIDPDFALGA